MNHKSPLIRRWVVRLLGDPKKVEPTTAARLRKLAQEDESPLVRSQLASTGKRLPTKDAMPIIRALLARNDTGDEKDPYIPLLLWWAVEQHCVVAELDLPEFLTTGSAAKNPIVKETILPRLVRRYIAAGTSELDEAVSVILGKANAAYFELLRSVEIGMQERSAQKPFAKSVIDRLHDFSIRQGDHTLFRILIRLGDHDAVTRANEVIFDTDANVAERIALLQLFGSVMPASRRRVNRPNLEALIMGKEQEAVKLAAISTLAQADRAPPERSVTSQVFFFCKLILACPTARKP